MNEDLIQKFGYTEMYEWNYIPTTQKHGHFVQFSKENPEKIEFYHDLSNPPIGVSSICSVSVSDDPDEWGKKNMCNEVGDLYLRKERLAVGQKVYDQYNELNYIQTRPWEHLIPITNEYYKNDVDYVKRSNRQEWVRVNLIGKVIVLDNGECKPGEYCTPYTGKLKEKYGTVVPAEDDSKYKYYVLKRFSDKSIIILNK